MDLTAQQIVERFQLSPHPEGGYYRETYRADLNVEHTGLPEEVDRARSASTAIYFLMPAGDFSAFHRVTATDEMWHLYAGGPLELHLIHEDGRYEQKQIGTDLTEAEPTLLVKAGCWQAARAAPGAAWAFGGCTVAPGFDFADFQMPDRFELLERFPQHRGVIEALTRPGPTS